MKTKHVLELQNVNIVECIKTPNFSSLEIGVINAVPSRPSKEVQVRAGKEGENWSTC